jgi:predicted nucleic acid-binding protein
MILLDANLLIYASAPETPQHGAAKDWLDERLNGSARVALPWPSLLAFLRIVSNPKLFEGASLANAQAQVKSWLDLPITWIPNPTEEHGRILTDLLALEHGLVLCSSDGDFARFPQLRWENPLT